MQIEFGARDSEHSHVIALESRVELVQIEWQTMDRYRCVGFRSGSVVASNNRDRLVYSNQLR